MDKYQKLKEHLKCASDRSEHGKGKERHADDNNWEDQNIILLPKLLKDHPAGSSAPAYQALKKIIESGRLYNLKGKQSALNELYDAIVYISATAEIIKGLPDGSS